MKRPRLEVLIAAYGEAGIKRIIESNHPKVAGVIYTVSWQIPEGQGVVPPELSEREDFRVFSFDSKGLSVNRNHGLDIAIGDVILIGDDDLDYSEAGLKGVLDAFAKHSECDFLTFRYESERGKKPYVSEEFDWNCPPKGVYVSSVEIAFRREKVVGFQRFNEHFGVNGDFCAGEEDLFMGTMLRRGLKGRFIPHTVCRHPEETTTSRADSEAMVETKGAVFLYLHPYDWVLRMMIHAVRSKHAIGYCRHWLRGVRKAIQLKVFKD